MPIKHYSSEYSGSVLKMNGFTASSIMLDPPLMICSKNALASSWKIMSVWIVSSGCPSTCGSDMGEVLSRTPGLETELLVKSSTILPLLLPSSLLKRDAVWSTERLILLTKSPNERFLPCLASVSRTPLLIRALVGCLGALSSRIPRAYSKNSFVKTRGLR